MKKIVFVIILVSFFNANILAANENVEALIKYQLNNISVNSYNGEYIEDVFSKYDKDVYDSEFEQCLLGQFSYQVPWGSLKTEFGLLDCDQYLLELVWEENLNLRAGTKLQPDLPNYIFSNREDKDIGDEYPAGIISDITKGNWRITPLYLKLEDDLAGFLTEIDTYGIDTQFRVQDNLVVGTTALRTEPEDKIINDIKDQNNYSLRLDYQPHEWLTIDTDLARSIKNNDNYTEKVYSNLALINLAMDVNSNLSTELSYHQVHELYAPLRTTEYNENYDFRDTDYNQGYQLDIDYRLPKQFKSTLKFKYSDFKRTNSYIQAAPYVQQLGVADKLLDDQIDTYQLGVISETGKFYSRVFYTYEVTTNDTSTNIKVDPKKDATENEDLENDYSPGYKDKTINTIHLYGKYRLLTKKNYSLSVNGRYVWEEEDNKYHNHNPNLGNLITENVIILGLENDYQINSDLSLDAGYSIEQRDIDFKVGPSSPSFAEGRLQNLKLGINYKINNNSSLNFDYHYQIYDLLDHSDSEEIYRYYDHDFDTQEINLILETKF